ncbi:FecCD family ABC transporter permease [Pasteurella bettyae]|uniref:FecCD family ABC transporter permease n=1 Tax=Pasteurella bettyae TaxID=752 RepID=UPI003D2E725A
MKNYSITVISFIILLIFTALLSLSLGRFAIPIEQVWKILILQGGDEIQQNVIFNLRLPRVIAAILIGASMAIAGTTFQGVFRNPLVSPGMLGVSSGACIGAALAIIWSWNIWGIQIAAFIGGIFAVTLTLAVPQIMKKDSAIILVLAGVIVSGFMGACMGLITYMADPETQLADIVYWQLGSLTKSNYTNLLYLSPIIIISGVALFAMRWRINLLSLGEQEAKLIGVNIKLERNIMIACSTLLTASSVCLSGTIGWIGLIIPHLARMFIGDNNLQTLPIAALIGSIFLLVIDTLARNLYVQEIPLGILTGLIGAPFFAWILIRQKVVD